jgi:hypothetical protein
LQCTNFHMSVKRLQCPFIYIWFSLLKMLVEDQSNLPVFRGFSKSLLNTYAWYKNKQFIYFGIVYFGNLGWRISALTSYLKAGKPFCFIRYVAYTIFCFRSTLMGFDLNRTWHQISRWAHPTLHAVQTMVTELDQSRVSVTERTKNSNIHISFYQRLGVKYITS